MEDSGLARTLRIRKKQSSLGSKHKTDGEMKLAVRFLRNISRPEGLLKVTTGVEGRRCNLV